jgi:ABC-type uncharacterized transport system substrate-binding protein
MNVTTSSKQFTLNLNDFWKGLIMAVLTPVVTIVYQSIEAGSLTFNWKAILMAAVAGFMGYLMKNFFDKPKVVVTGIKDDTLNAVIDGAAKVEIKHQ